MGFEMEFDFSTAQRIIFGWGSLDKLPSIISKFVGQNQLTNGHSPTKKGECASELQLINIRNFSTR